MAAKPFASLSSIVVMGVAKSRLQYADVFSSNFKLEKEYENWGVKNI